MAKKTTLPIYADEVRQDVLNRLGKVEGQVRGVARMVEEQRTCVEVLEQLASATSALRGAGKVVLRNYLECCATESIRSGDCAIYGELMDVIFKFAK